MMIRNSERREVAARLRSKREGSLPEFLTRAALGVDYAKGTDMQKLPKRLADLIDRPTCHMEHTDTYRTSEGLEIRTWECDRCGRTCEEVNGDYEFCPHCGAEVVND